MTLHRDDEEEVPGRNLGGSKSVKTMHSAGKVILRVANQALIWLCNQLPRALKTLIDNQLTNNDLVRSATLCFLLGIGGMKH